MASVADSLDLSMSGSGGMDEALLSILTPGVSVYARNTECLQCIPWYYGTVPAAGPSLRLTLNTTFPTEIHLWNSTHICSVTEHFGEHGVYQLSVPNTSSNGICLLTTVKEPVNCYLPILWTCVGLLGVFFLWLTGSFIYRWRNRTEEDGARLLIQDMGAPMPEQSVDLSYSGATNKFTASYPKPRVSSLDAFRGLCIVLMTFVNYGGGHYWFFEHSHWNGLTLADVVFPWFMWVMGAAVALSVQSQLRKAVPKRVLLANILRRSCILFALGIALNSVQKGGPASLSTLRIPGVLQRFSLTYLIVASLHVLCERAGDVHQFNWWSRFRDIIPYWPQWILVSLFIAAHTLITFLLPVPGCPSGYLGPGGLHMEGMYRNCTGGAAGYIDRLLLGPTHLYQRPNCKVIYDTNVPYDPEGILGFLTATFAVFLGLQAGKILVLYGSSKQKISYLAFWAVVTGGIGTLLCCAEKDNGMIPVNKNLWSLSYVLVTCGLAFAVFALLFIVVDGVKLWSGAPLSYAGMNAIVLYVGHVLTKNMFPWQWQVEECHLHHLLMAMWGTLLWVVVAWWLHTLRFFVAL